MTVAAIKTSNSGAPPHRRWSGTEYLRLADLGFFDGQRVELIDGEIIQMSPIHNPHAAAVTLLSQLLITELSRKQYWVRVQATLAINDNYPEPDIAIVPGPISSKGTFPTSALMVIEVSDSTLKFDQKEKMSLYAAANIPDYWIINLNARQIEVFRSPSADSTQPFGSRYGESQIVPFGKSVSPLFHPSLNIPVADIIQ